MISFFPLSTFSTFFPLSGWRKITEDEVFSDWAADEIINRNWKETCGPRALKMLSENGFEDDNWRFTTENYTESKEKFKNLLKHFFRYPMIPKVINKEVETEWYEKKMFAYNLKKFRDWTGAPMVPDSLNKPGHSYWCDRESRQKWGINELGKRVSNTALYDAYKKYVVDWDKFYIHRLKHSNRDDNFVCIAENLNDYSKFVLIEGNHRARWHIRDNKSLFAAFYPITVKVGIVKDVKEAVPHIVYDV